MVHTKAHTVSGGNLENSLDNLEEALEGERGDSVVEVTWGEQSHESQNSRWVEWEMGGGRKEKFPLLLSELDSPAQQWGMCWHTTEPAAEKCSDS